MSRDLDVDIAFPLNGKILHQPRDRLNISRSKDNSYNDLEAKRYSVENARQNWIGSSEYIASIKWWATGGEQDLEEEFLNPHYAVIMAARLKNEFEAALIGKYGKWEKFLGRKINNYIVTPVSIFDHPRGVTLSLKHSCQQLPWIQAVLYPLNDAVAPYKYQTPWRLRSISDKDGKHHPCMMLEVSGNSTPATRVTHRMIATNNYVYSWKPNFETFYALLTWKLSYRFYLNDKKHYRKLQKKFDFDVSDEDKQFILQKIHPLLKKDTGKKEYYTQDQLFFIASIRHVCRASWKLQKHSESQAKKHYHLEAAVISTLMQMEEFSKVFKCKKKQLMNNKGERRCLEWTPEEKSKHPG